MILALASNTQLLAQAREAARNDSPLEAGQALGTLLSRPGLTAEEGGEALKLAVRINDLALVEKVLGDSALVASIKDKTADLSCALCSAASNDYQAIVKRFLQKEVVHHISGEELDIIEKVPRVKGYETTANLVHHASLYKHSAAVLLEAGA